MSIGAPQSGREAISLFWDGVGAAPKGWTGVNLAAESLAREGLPVATGTVDRLYIGPSVGRLPSWVIVDALVEFRRVLRVGGVVRVAAYDIDAAIQAYLGGDESFFWDDSWGTLAGRFGVQLLESGRARTLLSVPMLAEALRAAGFDDIATQAFKTSSDSFLAAPDRFARQCCYVEARNGAGWPTVDSTHEPRGIHLSWSDPHCDGIKVVWSAAPDTEGRVRFRPSGATQWVEAAAESVATIDGSSAPAVFHATCTPLVREQRYDYEVIQTAGAVDVARSGSFTTLPADPNAVVTFAFISDTGVAHRRDGLSDTTLRVLEEVRSLAPDLVVGGGDYAHRSSDARLLTGQHAVHAWLEQIEPLASGCPLMMQYGNHEVTLGEYHRDWAVHFPPMCASIDGNVRSYSFEAGPCHIVGFYAPTEHIDAGELIWLWRDLSNAQAHSRPWIIVFQHQPLVAHGTSHPAHPMVAQALAPVLEHHGVDLHLSAHDQNYERTFPLTWRGCVARASSHATHRYSKGEGVLLAKVSPSGKGSDLSKGFSALPVISPEIVAVAHDSAHHFAVVEADASVLVLRTYGVVSKDAPLEIVDEIVIEAELERRDIDSGSARSGAR